MDDGDYSEGMQEIQNEETFTKQILMWIDSSSITENLISFFGFFLIIVLTLYTGIYNTPSINVLDSPRNFTTATSKKFSFDAAPISSYNRFISFDMAFIKKKIDLTVDTPINFTYQVEVSSQEQTYNKTVKDIALNIHGDAGNNLTQYMSLFRDDVIDYQSIEFIIYMNNYDPELIEGINIIIKLGTHDYSTFQSYFRCVYALFQLFSLINLFRKLKSSGNLYLHKEQRLLIPLIVCSFLANNPFYFFQACHSRHIYFFYEALATACFEGYVWFHVLAIFDILRDKNLVLNTKFYLPKIVICFFIAFSRFLIGAHRAISTFSEPQLFGDSTANLFRSIEIFFFLIFTGYSIFLFIQSILTFDSTERFKFYMYTFSNFSVLVFVVLARILNPIFGIFSGDETENIITFVIENIYVLMMIYYHWPYESQIEQNYVDGQNSKGDFNQQIADIADPMLINDDDDDELIEEDIEEEEEEEE